MEILLNEVFVKEVNEAGIDRVVVLKNVPRRLFYRWVPKMVQRVDRDGYTDGTMAVDPSGEKVEALLEGMSNSRNGDGSIVVDTKFETGRAALKAIRAYVNAAFPRDVVLPEWTNYPIDPTNSRSMPKPKSMIPVIELPTKEDIKAESPVVSPEGNTSPQAPAIMRTRKPMSEEAKKAAGERLAKAREMKKQLKTS